MGSRQIRVGQLIAPFGPGSIYTDRDGTPHIVAGLDFWHKSWDQTLGEMVNCDKRDDFEIAEPRLSNLLRIDRFSLPPDYRHVRKGFEPPPNANLYVPALRFPCWYRHTKTGQLRRFNPHTSRVPRPSGGGRWQPVRFVSVCATGHLSEFPWKEWIECACDDDGDLRLIDRGGSELTSVTIKCKSCPQGSVGHRGKNLAGTTVNPGAESGRMSAFQRQEIGCPGNRPWLGSEANEDGCTAPLIGALINQTNLYFPKTISALALPDLKIQDKRIAELRAILEQDAVNLPIARTLWELSNHDGAITLINQSLSKQELEYEPEEIREALESLFSETSSVPEGTPLPEDPEDPLLVFRREEFYIVRNQIDEPKLVPDLRVISTNISADLKPWIERVNLVERLRETRVFYGFDRLTPGAPLDGMPESAMKQLFRTPPQQPTDRWLPAIKVFGEGIYVELAEEAIKNWQRVNRDHIRDRISDAFMMRLSGIRQTLPPLTNANRDWASRYLLVHSFAHILINQLVFECGYSTASLRERLFISSDGNAPMASFLIYTAAGDTEGTLGGLVRLGRPDRFGDVLTRALVRASWCSADPICSENMGGQGSQLANLAACHSCILLPETSCETINHGLDRCLLVGTPESRTFGFFWDLIENSMEET